MNAADGAGQTALHRTAHEGLVQVCRVLLAHGADTSCVSSEGYTPMQLATENVQKLLQGECQLFGH